MTEQQLADRILYWQVILTRLGIGHWELKLSVVDSFDEVDDQDDTDTAARCIVADHRDSATFEFLREALSDDDLDVTIVHELLHVVWRDHDEAMRMVEGYMPAQTALVDFKDRMEHENEKLIERLARLIVTLHGE